ncbi:uncharacterized protein [Aegilops tauschii subsp. strangulata]|uniref:Uncharacterized protein n=1 Tax=Aegilops tauschii TaxID=37682 RepID=R7WED3_AEGTA|nr:uncharacterized protein LOC109753053 isoform X2 [Aegilops tauschii subsp. strangulata]
MVRAVSMDALVPGMLGLSDELYVKGYEIEGLRTKFVAYRERIVEEVNRTLVSVEVQQPDGTTLALDTTCFGVVGSMTVNNLGELLTGELQANGLRPVAFSADGIVLPEDCLFAVINKQFPSKNGFISLLCITENIEEEEEDIVDGAY